MSKVQCLLCRGLLGGLFGVSLAAPDHLCAQQHLGDKGLGVVGAALGNNAVMGGHSQLGLRPLLQAALGVPITTVVFHLERMLNAGIIGVAGFKPGIRGKAKIYTPPSRGFLVLTGGEPRETLKNIYDTFLRSFDRLLRKPMFVSVLLLAIFSLHLLMMLTGGFVLNPMGYGVEKAAGPIDRNVGYETPERVGISLQIVVFGLLELTLMLILIYQILKLKRLRTYQP